MAHHTLKVQVLCAKQLPAMDRDGLSDPYVQFEYKGTTYKTEIIYDTNNPDWNQTFSMTYDKQFGPHTILFEIYDYNTFSKNELMGSVLVGFEDLEVGPAGKTDWHTLDHVRKGADGAVLRVRLELKPPIIEQANPAASRPAQHVVPAGAYQTPVAPYQQAAGYGYGGYGYAYQQQVARAAYGQPGYPYQQAYRYPYYQQAPAGYDASRWQHAVQALEESSSSSSSSSDSDSSKKKKKKKDKKEKKDKKDKKEKKNKKGKGDKTEREVEAKPELMLEIKDIFPAANYKLIAKCLRNSKNDKTEAMKQLVEVMEEDNADPRLKELKKAARGDDD